jgi:hypothetical protein
VDWAPRANDAESLDTINLVAVREHLMIQSMTDCASAQAHTWVEFKLGSYDFAGYSCYFGGNVRRTDRLSAKV